MIKRLRKYWQYVIASGVNLAPNEQLQRKIELANLLSVCLFVLGSVILVTFVFFVPYTAYIIANVAVLVLAYLIPFWNRKGYYNFTRMLICIVLSLAAGILPLIGKIYLFGDQTIISMYYIPRYFLLCALIAPLLLIDLSEKWKLVICLLVNAFFLFGFDWIDTLFGVGFYQKGYHTEQYLYINFYVLINYLFLLFALVYLQRHNKNYEQRIILLNQNLDNKVKQKTKELKDANTDLKAFNYTVSHELKTPLTAAKMLTHTLMEQYGNQLGEKGREHLQTIDSCVAEMQQLIKNIMTFSGLAGQEMNKTDLDMNLIFQEVLDELTKIGLPDNLKIIKHDLPKAKADKAMIKLVAGNLLSNAIKYTRTIAHPMIEIGAKTLDDKDVYYVKDNGIGFQMEQRNKLFKLFERLHSKTTYEGSGVGLAIARRTISRHGGKIWAEGKPGDGAVFYFSLP